MTTLTDTRVSAAHTSAQGRRQSQGRQGTLCERRVSFVQAHTRTSHTTEHFARLGTCYPPDHNASQEEKRTDAHTFIRACVHIQIHIHIHLCKDTESSRIRPELGYEHAHTYPHTHFPNHAHARLHIHLHAHTQAPPPPSLSAPHSPSSSLCLMYFLQNSRLLLLPSLILLPRSSICLSPLRTVAFMAGLRGRRV